MEALNKGLAKLLLKPIDAQKLIDPEKVSTIWVKDLNKIVNKMNNTVSSIIGMKPKDAIKLDTFINLVNDTETKKDVKETLFGAKIHID